MVSLHALGALRLTSREDDIALGGPRQRRLLAVLLVHRNQVVSTDRIADAVFAGVPSDAAATTLRSYVARLRRALLASASSVSIRTVRPGYQLLASNDEVDVGVLEDAVHRARAALDSYEPDRGTHILRRALSLWQGTPYAEFADEPWVFAEVQRLTELRHVAHELLVTAELACGRTDTVLPLIEGLCAEHPLREGYRSQLMTAYYGSGRQAEALATFHRFRHELAEELGIDPSPTLVDLEHRILVQDPTLLVPAQRGESLRGYQLGERLGTGRDGTVRVARLPGVEQVYALKTLAPEVADDAEFIRLFDATARQVATLRHPGVLALHDFWREPAAAYVVTPRMVGGTLRDRLRARALAHDDLAAIVDRIGGALVGAGAAAVHHGAVTAENVLYDGDGLPVLSDFWLGQPSRSPVRSADRDDFLALVRECAVALPGPQGGITAGLDELTERVPETLEELVHDLAVLIDGRSGTGSGQRVNPYVGLRAFDESDASYYFGRDALVDHLVRRTGGDNGRLVLLVGASGTGKSSAVRAGLLPRLRAGAVPGSEQWFITTLAPGATPYRALAGALRSIAAAGASPDRWAVEELETELAGSPTALHDVLGRLLDPGRRAVLVVDQLEELFTTASQADQRSFLTALADAVTRPDGRVRVVATLRADYYDRPLAHQPFGALVGPATVAIPAMVAAEIEAAVVEPARRAGHEVERTLVAELVGHLATDAAGLPALQFVLYELAERSSDGLLRLRDYHDLGGMAGAIAARAEHLYLSLDDADRAQVRTLFEHLVVVGTDREPTRRRTLRADLSARPELVDQWVTARLLSVDVHPQNRMATVEVAHEALVREWPRLRDWVEEDREELIVLGRLHDAATTWDQLGRDPAALYRGSSLVAATDTVSRRRDVGAVERSFLAASHAAEDEEHRDAAELIRIQARTNRRLRAQLVGIAVALVGALLGGLLALDQRRAAVEAGHVALARELAAAAEANLHEDPERSMLLALAAIDATRRHGAPVLPEAQEALHHAVTSSRVQLSVPGAGGTLDWTSDGRWFTTEGVEETGRVDLYSAATGERERSWKGDEVDLNDVSFSADGRVLATSGDDGSVKAWSVPDGRHLVTHAEPGAHEVWGPSLNADGSLVAASWLWQDLVVVTDTRTGKPVARLRVPFPEETTFSPDGAQLAVVSERNEVLVFELATGRTALRLGTGTPLVRDISWSPDGASIAVAAGDGAAYIHDARTGRFRYLASGHIASVNGVDWSSDSMMLATASNDGTAKVYDVTDAGARERLTLSARDLNNGVRSVAFSPDDAELMTGDWAITAVKIWDIHPLGAAEIANVAGAAASPNAAAMTPDGRAIYVTDRNGVQRRDLTTGGRHGRLEPIPPGGGEEIHHIVLSPDGTQLAAATDHGLVFVWSTATGRIERRIGASWGADWIEDVDWSDDGRLLAVSTTSRDESGTVFVLDGADRVVGQVREPPGRWMPSVDFHGGDLLVTAQRNTRDDPALQQVLVWHWRSGDLIRSLDARAALVADDPTGRLIASARLLQGFADVWDRRTGEHLLTLTGHTASISDIDFSDDGSRLATSSSDGTARVWDAHTGELVVVLRSPVATGVGSVAFGPDDRMLAAGDDGVVRIWTLDLDELIGIAHDRMTRGLTAQECRRYLHLDTCSDVARHPERD